MASVLRACDIAAKSLYQVAQVSGMKDQLLQARNAIMEEKFAARDARIKYKR